MILSGSILPPAAFDDVEAERLALRKDLIVSVTPDDTGTSSLPARDLRHELTNHCFQRQGAHYWQAGRPYEEGDCDLFNPCGRCKRRCHVALLSRWVCCSAGKEAKQAVMGRHRGVALHSDRSNLGIMLLKRALPTRARRNLPSLTYWHSLFKAAEIMQTTLGYTTV